MKSASVALSLTLAACIGQTRTFAPAITYEATAQRLASKSPIQHVVIIVQENRSPDYLFQGIPGADISKYAIDSRGHKIALRAVSLAAGYDLPHNHFAFITDYDNGKMDGFDRYLPAKERLRPYGYAPASEVRPYHDMAKQYVFADRMFQSNEGPSFPAHLFLVSGTASDPPLEPYKVLGDPYYPKSLDAMGDLDDGPSPDAAKGGCDSALNTLVSTLRPADGAKGPAVYPCFDRVVLSDLLDAKGLSWRYYQYNLGPGLWHAFDSIRHVRYGPDYAYVITPPQQVLKDIRSGNLANVSWVIPANRWSDHANSIATTKGPTWVAAIVNDIGESRYWKNTAIFIVWDDWGGWYDHVKPPIRNHYELGFRVPLVIVSPYARSGYVSKVQHEFGSLLVFTEKTFGIPKGSLHASDRGADDLMDAFDFTQKPRVFKHIESPPFDPGRNAGLGGEDP